MGIEIQRVVFLSQLAGSPKQKHSARMEFCSEVVVISGEV